MGRLLHQPGLVFQLLKLLDLVLNTGEGFGAEPLLRSGRELELRAKMGRNSQDSGGQVDAYASHFWG